MPENDPDLIEQARFFRDQALKARRLAGSVSDERVISALLAYALELEERAVKLEAP